MTITASPARERAEIENDHKVSRSTIQGWFSILLGFPIAGLCQRIIDISIIFQWVPANTASRWTRPISEIFVHFLYLFKMDYGIILEVSYLASFKKFQASESLKNWAKSFQPAGILPIVGSNTVDLGGW